MKICEIVSFHKENFFEGAVQLRWLTERPEHAINAARAYVFHGPRYHAAADAESDGFEKDYRLKDSASFVRDLLLSLQQGLRGEEVNPYWLAVAGYGAGKSHLALTAASLLAHPDSESSKAIIGHLAVADATISQEVQENLAQLHKPSLILALDGMAGFHLGNALVQAVLTQLKHYGLDADPIRALSPRFSTAEQFVTRNFEFRHESFAAKLPGFNADTICERLRANDEEVYNLVDAIYLDANGSPIPVVGQESAQELINTLCDVYCGENGFFSNVIILFDEFGRYLEYAAEKPLLAGDAALQQIFQGIQDNSQKIRFVGFIQYELKAYLKRFGSSDLRQLQRYITRFDSAQKWYLSTNLETIFAHMIGKNTGNLEDLWLKANAIDLNKETWHRMSLAVPEFTRYPVWNDFERFSKIIAQGCWPLHPLATWFLTRQKDVVQSRSALTFIKEMIDRIADDHVISEDGLRQVSAAELILTSMLSEMIAAEHQTGSSVAETLQVLLEKLTAHLSEDQRLVLAGVAILEKMRIAKQTQDNTNLLLCEATALSIEKVTSALNILSQDLGAVEWNRDLGQYELIADALTRGQFQQWLRKQQGKLTPEKIQEQFVLKGCKDCDLNDITTDFGQQFEISTQEWHFESKLAHSGILSRILNESFQEWSEARTPADAKGKVIYIYIHADEDLTSIEKQITSVFSAELSRLRYEALPVWVIGLYDQNAEIADHLGRLHLFEDQMSLEEKERFRRFVPDEIERSRRSLKEYVQSCIKGKLFWIAGFNDMPNGRIRQVGNEIFKSIYPKSLPFPFDGFATAAGGGAADTAQLTRALITHQVDGNWVQTQPKRLQNRTTTLLSRSWLVLQKSGKLSAPAHPSVKMLYELLEEHHQSNAEITLWQSYQLLIAPPFGMNTASAGVLLGLLIGGISPPRRLEYQNEMIAAADWVAKVFSSTKNKHFFDVSVLQNTRLKFLSEDSEGRWRNLLDSWDQETNYLAILDIAKEVEQTRKIDPMPEVLDGNYKYLIDKTRRIEILLRERENELNGYELGIEKANRFNDIGQFLRLGSKLINSRDSMLNAGTWPDSFIKDCDQYIQIIQQEISPNIDEWISRQSCNSQAQVADFRYKMERSVKSLELLGYKTKAKKLQDHYLHCINHVEALQKFVLTLDKSSDYPNQPHPTNSTLVRELRDEINEGEELIEGVEKASSVLSQDEITSRINAIKSRILILREKLDYQNIQLGKIYELSLDKEIDVNDALINIDRLQKVFSGTPDESELMDMIKVLKRVNTDISAWETDTKNSPEQIKILLQSQIDSQLMSFNEFIEAEEIEPVWDIKRVYENLIKERVDIALKRSSDWLAPRESMFEKLDALTLQECISLENMLSNKPNYLSNEDKIKSDGYLTKLKTRLDILREEERKIIFNDWAKPIFEIKNIDNLNQVETEKLLKTINNPPVELNPEERDKLKALETQLTYNLDKISMNDIVERIKRLPNTMKQKLFKLLKEWQ